MAHHAKVSQIWFSPDIDTEFYCPRATMMSQQSAVIYPKYKGRSTAIYAT